MAFVPSQDGHEVTVLLLNVPHDYQLSDGNGLAHHKPILVARAGDCSGDCPKRDSAVAEFIYGDQSVSTACDSLEAAVGGGGAWDLTGSDLSVQKASASDPPLPALTIQTGGRNGIIPTTSAEREDFSWVADLSQVAGSGYALNSDLLTDPPDGLVAARFRIRSGKVFTYRVARIGSNVTPVHFQRLDGTGSTSSYSQAVATWVGAEVEVEGDSIQIVDETYNEGAGRSMTLTPGANGQVEVAVINLPTLVPPASPFTGTPAAGRHYEVYYDIAESPIAQEDRLVPKPGAASGAPSYDEVTWSSIHPAEALWSDLLNALRLNIGRTASEEVLCPPTRG